VEDDSRDAQDPHDYDIRCTVHVRSGSGVRLGHAVSVNARFHRAITKAETIEDLARRAGRPPRRRRRRLPDPARRRGVSTRCSSVRVRDDPTEPGSINLWITGDNLRKGAALNAVADGRGALTRLD